MLDLGLCKLVHLDVLFVSPATKSIPPDADDLEPEAKRKRR